MPGGRQYEIVQFPTSVLAATITSLSTTAHPLPHILEEAKLVDCRGTMSLLSMSDEMASTPITKTCGTQYDSHDPKTPSVAIHNEQRLIDL